MSSHARALGNFTHMLSLTLTEILLFCVHNMCLQGVMHECRDVSGCHNLCPIAILSLPVHACWCYACVYWEICAFQQKECDGSSYGTKSDITIMSNQWHNLSCYYIFVGFAKHRRAWKCIHWCVNCTYECQIVMCLYNITCALVLYMWAFVVVSVGHNLWWYISCKWLGMGVFGAGFMAPSIVDNSTHPN